MIQLDKHRRVVRADPSHLAGGLLRARGRLHWRLNRLDELWRRAGIGIGAKDSGWLKVGGE